MKASTKPLLVGAACAVLIATCAAAAAPTQLRVGTGRAKITPESIAEGSRFKGVYGDMHIRVMAFDDGEKKALLIASETQNTPNALWDEMVKRIGAETSIAPEYIIMSAVHTHSGPPMNAFFKEQMMAAVRAALGNLQPARIGAGKGECLMNMNRRGRMAMGGVWLAKNPYGACDHEVGVLRIDNEQGRPASLMVNWAAHATANWPEPTLHSGDWPAAAAKFLEKNWAGIDVPVTIGASGDIAPLLAAPYPSDKKLNAETTDRNAKVDVVAVTGMYVGEEAVRVADAIVTHPGGNISAVQRELVLPGKKPFSTRMPNQEIVRGDDLRVRLSALKVGNIVFAGFGAEVMTEIGMELKERSPYRNTFVITHCNGSSGYLVTDAALKEGGYEPGGSRSMPGCETALVENMLEMIHAL